MAAVLLRRGAGQRQGVWGNMLEGNIYHPHISPKEPHLVGLLVPDKHTLALDLANLLRFVCMLGGTGMFSEVVGKEWMLLDTSIRTYTPSLTNFIWLIFPQRAYINLSGSDESTEVCCVEGQELVCLIVVTEESLGVGSREAGCSKAQRGAEMLRELEWKFGEA